MANTYEELLKKYPDLKKRIDRMREFPMQTAILDPSAPRVEIPTNNDMMPKNVQMKTYVPAALTKEPLLNTLRGMAGVPTQEYNQPAPVTVQGQPMGQAQQQPDSGDLEKVNPEDMFNPPSQNDQEPPAPEEPAPEAPPEEEEDTQLAQEEKKAPPSREPASEPEAKKEEEKAPEQVADFTGPTAGTTGALQAAQAERNRIQQIAGFGKAFDLLGAGVARAQPVAQEFYKDMERQAGQQEEDLKALMQQEEHDPNSAVSKGFRDYVKNLGVDLKGASANTAKSLLPTIYRRYQNQVSSQAHATLSKELQAQKAQEQKDILAQTMQGKKDIARMVADNKSDIAEQNRIAKEASQKQAQANKKRGFKFDLTKATTSGQFGKQYGNLVNADRASQEIDKFMKNPTGYSDYATLMGGLKALQGDESVVREAEIRLGMDAGSFGDKVLNRLDKMRSGKSLQPAQRKDIANAVKVLREVTSRQYKDAVKPLMEQAEENEIPGESILPGIARAQSPAAADTVRVRLGNGQVVEGPRVNLKELQARDPKAQVLE